MFVVSSQMAVRCYHPLVFSFILRNYVIKFIKENIYYIYVTRGKIDRQCVRLIMALEYRMM